MRLINYEEYKNKLLKVRDSIPLTVLAASYELMLEKPYTHGMSMRGGIHKALKCLEQCQNVSDVAPVVYGEWGTGRFNLETGNYEEQCTRCRNFSKEYGKPYCPNCGAKMDGGANNAESVQGLHLLPQRE